MALLVGPDMFSIETLCLNFGDMNFYHVQFAGQSELLIEDNDLGKIMINHAVSIRNGPEFSLNAGWNVENSEAPTLKTKSEFQWCKDNISMNNGVVIRSDSFLVKDQGRSNLTIFESEILLKKQCCFIFSFLFGLRQMIAHD